MIFVNRDFLSRGWNLNMLKTHRNVLPMILNASLKHAGTTCLLLYNAFFLCLIRMQTSRKHIIVGMSGGVDSSVAAFLLKEQGQHVEGVFMKNWEEDDTDTFCPASVDMADAQA